MAVPATMTTLDISGKYMMSKTLSDDTDEILRLQGVGWFKRRVIKTAYLYLTVKHYKDDNAVEHIDIDQVLSGGFGNSTENRILDWQERPKDDDTFGAVIGKSKRAKVEDIENEYLREGWLDETKEHGVIVSYVQSDTAKSGTTWIAEQTWGLEEINGEKRYARHVYFIGPEQEKIQARLVYDYEGPVE